MVAAAIAALINFWLGYRIGQIRQAAKISIGDGGHEPLTRRMRAQANFIEHAPLTLILIGAIELAKGTTAWLWGLAALFLAARIAHALGMEGGGFQRLRGLGVMTSFLVEVVLVVIALKIAILG